MRRSGTMYLSSTRRKCSGVGACRRSGTWPAPARLASSATASVIGVALVGRRSRWQGRDVRTAIEVVDPPHRMDLVPVVVLVVHPGPEHHELLALDRRRELLAGHDLHHQAATLVFLVALVEELVVTVMRGDVDVVVAVAAPRGGGDRATVGRALLQHGQP